MDAAVALDFDWCTDAQVYYTDLNVFTFWAVHYDVNWLKNNSFA